MQTETHENKFFRIWFCCYPILFGIAYSQAVVFTSNQNTKFISGLALANYQDIASDWMAKISDPFPVFSHILKWQYELLGLIAGVHVAYLFLLALYAMTAVWLVGHIVERDDYRPRILFVFSLMLMFIHFVWVRHKLLTLIPDGLSDQYILGEYYQPCVLGVLLLTGTAAYVSSRTILAAACLISAALVHPTYVIAAIMIAASIIVLPANRLLEISWRQRLIFMSLFSFVIGAYAFWLIHHLASGDPAIAKQAHKLLAENRIPHHAKISQWDLQKTITFMVVGFAAAWFDRKQLIGQLIFVLLLVVVATLIWSQVAYSPTFVVTAPWRVSAYIAPLSWIILFSVIARWIQRLINKEVFWSFSQFIKVSSLCVLIFCAVGITDLTNRYESKKELGYYAISRFIENYHQRGFQYLIPIEESNIRLEAGVPVFATWKTHPTKDSEFLVWYERIETARTVYETKVDPFNILTVLKAQALTHVIWRSADGDYPYSQAGRQTYSDTYFSLWDMR